MAAGRSLAAAFFLLVCTLSEGAEVTPLQKVMEMLDGMAAKGLQAKHEEEMEFNAFQQWCDSLRTEKIKAIAEAKEAITQLKADIDKAEADAEALAVEIKALEEAIAKAKAELADATAIRKKEKADYDAQHLDFSESIDALERATQVLKTRQADVPQSLAQIKDSRWLDPRAKAVLTAFLEMGDSSEQAPPQAYAYEFQSGGVIGVMEKLRHKFQDQLLALEKEEMNAKANFENLAQALEDNIEYDTKSVQDRTARRAERLEFAAKTKAELAVTEKTLAEDEKILQDTLTECHVKSEEYEKNQVLRKDEIVAIRKALEILRSDEVSGNAKKYLPAALAQSAATSLAQLKAEDSHDLDNRRKAAKYLEMRAKKLGSQYLSMMAVRVTEDPFAKVKKMIKDLIVKLMEESNAEADHNAFCSAELATNKQTRENKAASVEDLTAKSEKLTADISLLTEEITQLADDIVALTAAQEEATALRAKEKATNEQTISDAGDGQDAVERAIKVLRDFYNKAASTALVQEPYKGMQSESGGIIGMLEVCLSDFARLETETRQQENQAQAAYEKFMAESQQNKEVKEVTKEHKIGNRNDAEADLRTIRKELALTQEELDKALEYYETLKKDCIDTGLSYEERVRAREEEIQSLQEALRILQGEDIA